MLEVIRISMTALECGGRAISAEIKCWARILLAAYRPLVVVVVVVAGLVVAGMQGYSGRMRAQHIG